MADDKLTKFLTEVKVVEKQDEKWTKEKQIDRLTRPGAKYRNINPYEVLQIEPDATETQIKKQYRKLSILVHPDKNRNDLERAKKAFDAVNEANQMLKDDAKMYRIHEVLEEAKFETDKMLDEKRKLAKAKGIKKIEEDLHPELYKEQFQKISIKLFADYEIKKTALEQKAAADRKRERETELAEEAARKAKKQEAKDWETNRDNRMKSWSDFTKDSKKKKKKKKVGPGHYKPPKLKVETR